MLLRSLPSEGKRKIPRKWEPKVHLLSRLNLGSEKLKKLQLRFQIKLRRWLSIARILLLLALIMTMSSLLMKTKRFSMTILQEVTPLLVLQLPLNTIKARFQLLLYLHQSLLLPFRLLLFHRWFLLNQFHKLLYLNLLLLFLHLHQLAPYRYLQLHSHHHLFFKPPLLLPQSLPLHLPLR